MEKVYESEHTVIHFDKDHRLFEVERNVPEKVSDKEFQNDFLGWLDAILKHRPQRQLIDNRNYHYTILPEMQNWVNINVLKPSFEAGLTNVAFVVPADIFSEVSISQTMEEQEGKNFNLRYFEDYEQAKEWLIKL